MYIFSHLEVFLYKLIFFFFFFNDTATTEIYTLPLHDALPISIRGSGDVSRSHPPGHVRGDGARPRRGPARRGCLRDRKSTRLNSSHGYISYAVFCLKKKKKAVYNKTTYEIVRYMRRLVTLRYM